MPLSEHEQRILDEIERRLADEDPKFARGVATATSRGHASKTLKRAILGFVAGLALLLVGLFVEMILPFGIAAFAVMLPCAVMVAGAAKGLAAEKTGADPEKKNWLGRAEERWKQRFDKDDA